MSAKLLFFRGQMDNLLLNLTKNTIFAHAKGKMQEWLNWPAWKASKPQKGFGGSNPPLSAKANEAKDVEKFRHLLFFNTTTHKFIYGAEWWEIKEVDL